VAGGAEDNLLIRIGRVGHQVVVGPDQGVDIDQIFLSGDLPGALMNHASILPSRSRNGYAAGPAGQGFWTTGTMRG